MSTDLPCGNPIVSVLYNSATYKKCKKSAFCKIISSQEDFTSKHNPSREVNDPVLSVEYS